MKKTLLYLIIMLLFGNCVFNHRNDYQIIIDKDVQKKAENEVWDIFDMNKEKSKFQYINNMYYELYLNDILVNRDYDNGKQDFWSYWESNGDTINIQGFFRNTHQDCNGFEINIVHRIPNVYLFLCSGMNGKYSYAKEGKVELLVKVPTETSKVTLSNIPNNILPKTIYGFVEFESKEFFRVSRYDETGEDVKNERNRIRYKMKMYFKANMRDSTFNY